MFTPGASDALSNYFGKSPLKAPGPGASDVAKFILLNAQNSKPMGPGTNKSEGPSVMSRIFDILSRPNYAIANTVRDLIADDNDVNPINSFISGLAGTQKTTFSDVLDEAGLPPSTAKNALGFGLDVALDPTTYVGPGAIKGAGKAIAKAVGKGGKVIEAAELPLGQKLLNSGTPVHPEAFGLPEISAQGLPDALKAATPDIPRLPDPANLGPKPGFTQSQEALPFEAPDIAGVLAGKPKASAPTFEKRIKIPDKFLENLDDTAPPVEKTKGITGQTALTFPGMTVKDMKKAGVEAKTVKATKIIEGIEQGDIAKSLELVPLPPPKINKGQSLVADNILKKFNPDAATAEINKKFPGTLNAKQQSKLWYDARNAVYKGVRKTNAAGVRYKPEKIQAEITRRAIPVYRAIEDKLVGAGKIPRIGTGDNVRLSDVIGDLTMRGVPITDDTLKEFGTKIVPGSEVHSAVERLRARGAITDSLSVNNIVEKIGESAKATKASGALSNAESFNFDKFLKNFGKTAAHAEDVSPAGVKATEKLINYTLDSGATRAEIAIRGKARILDEIAAGAKKRPEMNGVLTRALEKDLGSIPKWAVNNNKAVEGTMGRVATWWGQSDLRPMTLNAIGSAAATAAARGKVLGRMFQGVDELTRSEAFRLAQGIGVPSNPKAQDLARQIGIIMDDLTSQAGGSSVLLKSSVDMGMLNRWMRRYGTGFEFLKGTVKHPISGDVLDYSNGTDWLRSWKSADLKGKDPAEFMFKTMQALEQSTREKAVFDELGERFGSTVSGKSFRNKIEGFPYLEGYYFPEDIAQQIPRMVKDWSPKAGSNNQMLGLYDRVLSMWKSGVTIYRPAHHIRNVIGDTYLGMLDGVNSVKPYRLAAQVQRSMRGAYDTMADIDKLVEIGAMSKNMATPKPGQILFRNRSGVGFTAEQIGAIAHQKGLLEHIQTLEDIIDMGEKTAGGVSLTRPFGGKVQAAVRGASELQSHNARMAHFIDKVMKSTGKDLPKIFEEASRRARKFHPSGLDLTPFEKTVMRRIIPFYSWMRKSTPLLLEGMVMRPGTTVLPAKVGDFLQEQAGIEGVDRGNPFPVDQMFPSWLRDEGIGPISLPDGWLGSVSNQSPEGYVMGGVGLNPLAQLVAEIQHPAKTVLSGLTPVAKVPLELGTGNNLFTGAPITGTDAKPGALNDYIGEQIPLFGPLQGLTGVNPFGQETSKSQRSDGSSRTESLVNYLTGLGIKGTGPYEKSAWYEKTAPLKAQQKANKQDFLAELRNQMGQ